MSTVESVIFGIILFAMTVLIAICALAISPLYWIPTAMLVWANLLHWRLV